MKTVDTIRALFDAALKLGAQVSLSEQAIPGVGAELIRWAQSKDLKPRVELRHTPDVGSWRVCRVEHGRCELAVISDIDRTARAPIDESWRPSDGAS